MHVLYKIFTETCLAYQNQVLPMAYSGLSLGTPFRELKTERQVEVWGAKVSGKFFLFKSRKSLKHAKLYLNRQLQA